MASSASVFRWLVLMLLVCQVTQALISEGRALMRFKSNIIDRYENLYNWGYSEDPCGAQITPWVGVTCENDTQERPSVKELDLHSLVLSGSISEDLAGLENLRSLNLAGNSFSGQIPYNMGEFRSLTWLDLSNNMLTGRLPHLPPKLIGLYLQNNFLLGEVGRLGNMFDLSFSYLDIHGNNFTGKLPEQFLQYRVFTLDLSHNQFEGSLPSNLGEFAVSVCDLSHNQLEGKIPDGLYDLHSYFDLSGNKLTGSIPAQLFKDRQNSEGTRRYVNLSRNSLSGMIDFRAINMKRIKFLDLSFNELENEGDLEIGKPMAERLEFLDLRNNRFSGSVDRIFQANFSNLRELRLGGNKFVGGALALTMSTRAGFSFPRLEVMDVSGSGLVGEISSDLFRIENLPSLRVLDLSSNFLHGTVPASLNMMPELQELRLGNNRLQGAIYVDGNWSMLEVLDLSHNSFHFDGAEMQVLLWNFTNLRELRLGGSNPNWTVLPARVGFLPLLQILDLSSCNLIGDIPGQLSRTDLLPSLKYLNLSSNSLQGSLPGGFGQMPELIQLDVSNNELSGELPVFQFRLYNGTFFDGNEALCGPPLAECPQESKGSSTLEIWQIVVLVVAVVIASGGSCLLMGWMWRRNLDAKRQAQDAELIATLLDRDTTTLMPLRQLCKATNDFSADNEIGVGGFGTVYKGVLEDGTVVAIKKSKRDGSTSEDKRQFLNEVRILSQVHHRNLVRLLGCCLAHRNALLVFEFVSNGTLEQHLHREQGRAPLTWNQRLLIAIQMAGALDYLHSSANPPIYHLDVKSANILLDQNLNAKVADFGISKLAPGPEATHISTLHGLRGTFGYIDPESVLKSQLTDKSDVYAFGVVLLELITAKKAVERSRGEDISLVKWAERLIPKGRCEEIIDPVMLDTFHSWDGKESIEAVAGLAQNCLQFRSENRPTMKDVSTDLVNILQTRESSISRLRPGDRIEENSFRSEKSDLLETYSSVKGFTI